MLKLINEVHPNYQPAKQFFKDFKDESLIWTADRWAAKENMSKIGIFNILNERHSFEAIATYLESEFEKSNAEEIKIFLEKCYKYKLEYIPNEDLKFLEKDRRLCWLIINDFKNKYKEMIYTRYSFRNAYFSLVFLIHIELFSHHIKIDYLREYIKLINNEENPLLFLSKYINNPDFITWALKYTERKTRITTSPNSTSTNIDEQLDKFLGYWDFLYINDQYRYSIEINKLKKAWQQNIFRIKNKDNPKNKYHLPLRANTKKLLKELAVFKNISETEVLEILINEAYENEMCDKKRKALY
ncbi:hypothetical protein [Acinetobacter lwoffii]|uniref:hypothetical protein n=1 Tax=Acinetobacter lwoffii TaxID=28090 RepID=UPI001C92E1E5|nr:hypothetical protein [Acinetobacter lwoffii]QZM12898.1 hypothetical protein ABVS_2247 [Acinetobacter lwoffii]